MPSKKVIILCAYCSWKRICDFDNIGLHELKSDSMSSRKFRCPGCGRAIAPRKFPDPQKEVELAAKEDKVKEDNEAFIIEHAEFQRNFLKNMKEDE